MIFKQLIVTLQLYDLVSFNLFMKQSISDLCF